MKHLPITWDSKKNEILLEQRGISFQYIEDCIKEDKIIDIQNNTSENFSNQKLLIFAFENYIWACPCLIEQNQIVLKTAFPNRKLHALYSQYL